MQNILPSYKPRQEKPEVPLSNAITIVPNGDILSLENLQADADKANAIMGNMSGYNCPKCLNRGFVTVVEDDRLKIRICSCTKVRKCIEDLKNLGINPSYTFKNFIADQPWQQNLQRLAIEFTKNPTGWLFVGGQVGCGKSHICSAIVRNLLIGGHAAKYVMWEDTAASLKSVINEFDRYESIIKPLREAEILYIDDFLKPTEKNSKPTPADLRQAYAILNARYNNPKSITIISSEFWLSEILEMNEAVGSRIIERTGNNKVNVDRKIGRNYRLLDTGRTL